MQNAREAPPELLQNARQGGSYDAVEHNSRRRGARPPLTLFVTSATPCAPPPAAPPHFRENMVDAEGLCVLAGELKSGCRLVAVFDEPPPCFLKQPFGAPNRTPRTLVSPSSSVNAGRSLDRPQQHPARASTDGGFTWDDGKRIDPRPSSYSCMTILKGGSVGIPARRILPRCWHSHVSRLHGSQGLTMRVIESKVIQGWRDFSSIRTHCPSV